MQFCFRLTPCKYEKKVIRATVIPSKLFDQSFDHFL